jgi:hypothetical protein
VKGLRKFVFSSVPGTRLRSVSDIIEDHVTDEAVKGIKVCMPNAYRLHSIFIEGRGEKV